MDKQLSLGQLIDKLDKIQQSITYDPEVFYDFGRLIPSCLNTYRGNYNHLALGFKHFDSPCGGVDDSVFDESNYHPEQKLWAKDIWDIHTKTSLVDCDSDTESSIGALPLSSFLIMLRNAIGQYYKGYHGGCFTMGENTPLWVAQYGDTSNTMITDANLLAGEIIIHTAYGQKKL